MHHSLKAQTPGLWFFSHNWLRAFAAALLGLCACAADNKAANPSPDLKVVPPLQDATSTRILGPTAGQVRGEDATVAVEATALADLKAFAGMSIPASLDGTLNKDVTARMAALPKDHIQRLLKLLAAATGVPVADTPGDTFSMFKMMAMGPNTNNPTLNGGEVMIFQVLRMGRLFDETKFQQKAGGTMLKRMATLSPAVIKRWKTALERVSNSTSPEVATIASRMNEHSVALTLVWFDPIFENEKYSAVKATEFLKRLSAVPAQAVHRWVADVAKSHESSTDVLDAADAALRLSTMPQLYDGSRFLEDRFTAVLGAYKKITPTPSK